MRGAVEAISRKPTKFEGNRVWVEALRAYEICIRG